MKLPWKYIIIGVGIVVIGYGVVYAYGQYKFYKEKASIVDKQEEYRAELEKADAEHDATERELYKQLAQKKEQIAQKDREIDDLEKKLHDIVIPVNADDLVNAWGKVGIRASRRIVK